MVIGGDASTVTILIAIVLIYLLLGMFLEPIGAMLLTLPIVLPIIGAADLSLLWFGIILTKLLEIGMITPPIGMNVFVIKGVVGIWPAPRRSSKVSSGSWSWTCSCCCS